MIPTSKHNVKGTAAFGPVKTPSMLKSESQLVTIVWSSSLGFGAFHQESIGYLKAYPGGLFGILPIFRTETSFNSY